MSKRKFWHTSFCLAACLTVLSFTGAASAETEIETETKESEYIHIGSDFSTNAAETETESETEEADETEQPETNEAASAIGALIREIPALEEKDETQLSDISAVAENDMPAIVAITNVGVETIRYFGTEYEMDSTSTASGIIVGKNDTELLIATNNHVVEGAEVLTVCFSADTEEEDDRLADAMLKGTDSTLDLAVIAVKLEDISEEVAKEIGIIPMGESGSLQVGEYDVAIGNALGYGQSVTFGIVSALDREIEVSTDNGVLSNKMIQTDAAINFGNSGGALLNLKGELIGINSAKAAETGVEGMGYAIPIDTAKPIIEELMTQTTRAKVDAANAAALEGVELVDVSEEARTLYGIPNGAYVYELQRGCTAKEAGLCEGDIIVKLDQTAISSKSELLNRLQYYKAGETADVTVMRFGNGAYEETVLTLTLDAADGTQQTETEPDTEEEPSDDGDGYYDYGWQAPYSDGYGGKDDMFEDWYNYGGNGLGDLFQYFGF